MNKNLPNKWIRKELYELLNDIEVDDEVIRIYDTRVSDHYEPDHYIIMSTQTNLVQKENMCEDFWNSTINLDVITSYPKSGNPGSRLLLDNIIDEVRAELVDFELDPASGLKVLFQTFGTPTELFVDTGSENVFRAVISFSLKIK